MNAVFREREFAMYRIIAIASNTFRETIRDKILYNLLIFALLIIGLSYFLGDLTVMEQVKVIKDLGLASIHIFGALMAIFIGIGLVSKEIEKRTIYTIVSKPVSRVEFLIGKYLGLLATLIMNVTIMLAVLLGMLLLMNEPFAPKLIAASAFIFLELALLVAIALFFSTFSTPTLSAIFSLSFFVIGHLTGSIKFFGSRSESVLVQKTAMVFYYVFPNLENFNFKVQAAYDLPLNVATMAWAFGYAVLYAAMLMTVSVLIFWKRDFK